jgi:hypothetical protein
MLGPYSKLMQALPQISTDEYHEAVEPTTGISYAAVVGMR